MPRWQPHHYPVGLIHYLYFSQYRNSSATWLRNITNENFTNDNTNGQPSEAVTTTHLSHDTSTVVASIANRSTDLGTFVPLQDEQSEKSIKDFLARPVLWTTGVLATTDSASNFVNFSSDIYSPLQLDIWYSKIKGYYGIRFDMKVRLVINSNRYQQGRYILLYVPTAGTKCGTGNTGDLKIRSHIYSLTQRTTCPHVEIDVSCETECTLVIPYQCALPFLPIHAASQPFNLGKFFLVPYSPLVSPTGTANAGYSVFVSLEKVSFQGAAVPQMGTINEVEQEAAQIGPVSGALSKVARAATILGDIPLLKSVSSTTAWAADIAASVASVFGWSSPTILSPHTRVVRNTFQGWNNSDAADASSPISLLAGNTVRNQPGAFGTDHDEMSISYIAQKYAWLNTTPWDDTQASGTVLWTQDVTPLLWTAQTLASGKNVFSFLPVGLCADMHKYWRGGMKFRFKVAKTEFHSGRLIVSFHPYDADYQASASTTQGNTFYLQREIIDLRYGNEFEIVVPYMSHKPYRLVDTATAPTGLLQIHVLDKLTRPSSVSSSVSIMCEVAGAEDIEFAFPDNFTKNVAMVTTMQMADLTQECQLVSKPLGSMKSSPPGTDFAEICVGEKILSFRQYLKNTSYSPYSSTPANASIFLTMPYAWCAGYEFSAAVFSEAYNNADYFSILVPCFAAISGGVRIKYASASATANKWLTTLHTASAAAAVRFSTSTTVTAGQVYPNVTKLGLVVPTHPVLSGGLEIQVPMYSQTNLRPTADLGDYPNVPVVADNWISNPLLLRTYPLETIQPPAIGRRVADDFNCYGFISIPPMTESPTYAVATNSQ